MQHPNAKTSAREGTEDLNLAVLILQNPEMKRSERGDGSVLLYACRTYLTSLTGAESVWLCTNGLCECFSLLSVSPRSFPKASR